jgi:hypothetical protein
MAEPFVLTEIHHRQIDLRFYRGSDGLYEIVGRLIDTKSLPFRRQLASEDMPAGSRLHNISVHVVIDEQMLVIDASAKMDTTPFEVCAGATGSLQSLKGVQIGAGWNRTVRERLGGAISCTHIVELLGPMATTAFQGLAPQRLLKMNASGGDRQRREKVDSCYAYGAHREVVARLWPDLQRQPADQD